MSTILGIWAHPDDEVFVSGGLMADAVRHGDRVVCVHMTCGEAGLNFRKQSQPELLAQIRRRELKASLRHLGVGEQRFFGYRDGTLSDVPAGEATARILEALVDVQPDVILTFGPDGFTGHPDHTALSAWVSAAFRLWNKPGARLYHSAISPEWRESFVAPLNEFDMFWPGHPVAAAHSDLTVPLDNHLLDAKVDALRAHSSQMAPLFHSYGDRFMRALASEEHFLLADVGSPHHEPPIRWCNPGRWTRAPYARRSSSR
jgi:LmbE family N-acetylglucosaminyl deacetylase